MSGSTVQLLFQTPNTLQKIDPKGKPPPCEKTYQVHHDKKQYSGILDGGQVAECKKIDDKSVPNSSDAYNNGWAFQVRDGNSYKGQATNKWGVSCYSNVTDNAACDNKTQRLQLCPPITSSTDVQGTFKGWHYTAKGGKCYSQACPYNYSICEYPETDFTAATMTPTTMSKFGIDISGATPFVAKTEVFNEGQTNLDPELDAKVNQSTYNNVIMPKYCFTEVGKDTKYEDETCPTSYIPDPTTGLPRKKCSRLVSDGPGGDLCRQWKAQNTDKSVPSSFLSSKMEDYCKLHPANGDCDCIAAQKDPKNPLNPTFILGGQYLKASPWCFWKPCANGVSREYLQTASNAVGSTGTCPSVCANITQNIAKDGGQINSTVSSTISCSFAPPEPTPEPQPKPKPEPSSSHWLVWVIIVVGIILFLLLIVLVVIVSMRSKKGKSVPTKSI